MTSEEPPLAPFTVRWSGADSSLVVYIPTGSCNLSGYQVLMTAATDADWYIVADGSTYTSTDGKVINIVAHVKGRVKATSGGTIAPAIYVDAYDSTATYSANRNAGDVWSTEIATCTVTATTSGGVTTYTRDVSEVYQGAVTHLAPIVSGDLELYWYTDTLIATNGFLPYVDAQSAAPWCEVAFSSDVALTAPALLYVWYVVDCSGNTPTPTIVTSQSSGNPVPTAQQYYKASAEIYELEYGVVASDLRGTRLPAEVYYQ